MPVPLISDAVRDEIISRYIKDDRAVDVFLRDISASFEAWWIRNVLDPISADVIQTVGPLIDDYKDRLAITQDLTKEIAQELGLSLAAAILRDVCSN